MCTTPTTKEHYHNFNVGLSIFLDEHNDGLVRAISISVSHTVVVKNNEFNKMFWDYAKYLGTQSVVLSDQQDASVGSGVIDQIFREKMISWAMKGDIVIHMDTAMKEIVSGDNELAPVITADGMLVLKASVGSMGIKSKYLH